MMLAFDLAPSWQHEELERTFKELTAVHEIKPGELMLPLRIMLVGGKFGPVCSMLPKY